MITDFLEYLEKTKDRLPNKPAFIGEDGALTFQALWESARTVGSFLADNKIYHAPVVVFMQKSPQAIAATLGTLYAGCFYVVIDEEMPTFRIDLILQTLQAKAMICDAHTKPLAAGFAYDGAVFLYEDMRLASINEKRLAAIRTAHLDTDPMYAVFTSGSTGVPKGVLTSHRSVIDYTEHFSKAIGLSEDCIFANQAPLYFDAPMKEIGATLKYGATTHLVPKQLFLFPVKLIEYINEHKVNTLCWAASALGLVSSMKTFAKIQPAYVKTVTFVGEVFPVKQLNEWKRILPEARFFNLYGPTEATGVCCYYEVKKDFALEEVIPVGKPFANTDIFLLTDKNEVAAKKEMGEICIKGSCLALGYYQNPQKTAECFVQNPCNTLYPEIVYKTGDLGKINEDGDLLYVSRKDFQIKHMGHRIELGEIEVVTSAMSGIDAVCCLFDDDKKKIILYYTGRATKAEVASYIKEKLPRYMLPAFYEQLERMPYTANGKTDRVRLKEKYETQGRK